MVSVFVSGRIDYFPIQNVEKIRFRMSAVVAPVIESIGRSA
jgi:hypothetical protein